MVKSQILKEYLGRYIDNNNRYVFCYASIGKISKILVVLKLMEKSTIAMLPPIIQSLGWTGIAYCRGVEVVNIVDLRNINIKRNRTRIRKIIFYSNKHSFSSPYFFDLEYVKIGDIIDYNISHIIKMEDILYKIEMLDEITDA